MYVFSLQLGVLFGFFERGPPSTTYAGLKFITNQAQLPSAETVGKLNLYVS